LHIVHPVNGLDRELVEQAFLDHATSAASAFLRRLEDEVDGAGEISSLSKVFRGPEKHRHVAVMAATMHLPCNLRAVLECVRLHQIESVHVCPQSNCAPIIRLVTL
jgi:hypothetical protein